MATPPASGSTARLSDIALQAGVSEATVSRVLNGKAGVSTTTRQTVLAALDTLGYERPARLQARSAGLIGLITPELSNPIFPAFAQVIEQVLTRDGYTPVLCTQSPGGSTEDELTNTLVDRGVNGIIYVSGLHADSTADMDRYVKLAGRGVPFVMINGYTERVSAPFVSTDDRSAMRLAVQHLVELGHRQIGIMSRDRSADRLALPLQLPQQLIALVVVKQAAGAGDAGQPLAQLPRHLQRPLVLRQGQPQQPLTGVVALAEHDQQLRQPGRPQGFEIFGIEAALRCAFGRHCCCCC